MPKCTQSLHGEQLKNSRGQEVRHDPRRRPRREARPPTSVLVCVCVCEHAFHFKLPDIMSNQDKMVILAFQLA